MSKKKGKQPWLQRYPRNAQPDDNQWLDNTWYTYTAYTDSYRPYHAQPEFYNQRHSVPYSNNNLYENSNCITIDSSSNDDSDAESTPTTLPEKTVITKEGLYKDASSFHCDGSDGDNASGSTSTGAWTEAFWKKHDDNKLQSPETFRTVRNSKKRNSENKLEKSLNKMLAKPVEMSKGKSLLEKMGWQGGGLGKDGGGIVEPIAPKATYAVKTIGLGHPNEVTKVKKKILNPTKRDIKKELKRNFVTNVLLNILEFVRNDRKIEMFFDNQLFNGERKRIHQMVEKIRELDNLDDFEGFKEKDLDIVKDIWVHNMYELWTQSEGKQRNRQLCLYKEAPEYVYLITPDDLRDDAKGEEVNAKKENKTCIVDTNEANENNNDVKKEKVINHENDVVNMNINSDRDVKRSYFEKMNFVKSSTESNDIEVSDILGKIVGYFKEFSDDAVYIQFRCLGPFSDEEVENLNMFFDICMRKESKQSKEKVELLKVLDNAALVFDIQEDVNGSKLICKTNRNQLPTQN